MGTVEKVVVMGFACIVGIGIGGLLAQSDRNEELRNIELDIYECYSKGQRALMIRGEVICQNQTTE